MAKQRHKNPIRQYIFGSAGDDTYIVLTLDSTNPQGVAMQCEGTLNWQYRDAVMTWFRDIVFPSAYELFKPDELSTLAAMGFANACALTANHCIKNRPA